MSFEIQAQYGSAMIRIDYLITSNLGTSFLYRLRLSEVRNEDAAGTKSSELGTSFFPWRTRAGA